MSRTITAWFAGSKLHGTSVVVDLEQHNWKALKYQGGDEFYRITQQAGKHLVSIFVARGMSPEEQELKIREASIAALEHEFKREGAKP